MAMLHVGSWLDLGICRGDLKVNHYVLLVICYVAIEHDHRNSGFSLLEMVDLSIVMWLFTRGYVLLHLTLPLKCFKLRLRQSKKESMAPGFGRSWRNQVLALAMEHSATI